MRILSCASSPKFFLVVLPIQRVVCVFELILPVKACMMISILGQDSSRWDQLHLKGGDGMSLEAVQRVTEAEEKARARRAEAAEACKKLVSEAEEAGKSKLEQARREAEAQAAEALAKAEAAAAKDAQAVEQETEQACDALRKAAAGRLDDAAALIIRRVVGDSCP